MQGDADRSIEPSGAEAFAARLTCEHRYEVLPGFYHELLNEPVAERKRVLALARCVVRPVAVRLGTV
jgi:alpha-beta hydrolase superfamily lysophospholipase